MGVTFLIVDCDESKPSSHSDNAAIENVALVIGKQGRHEEAERQYRELVETRNRVSGPDHPRTRSALRGHGLKLMALGRYDEADEQLTAALERERHLQGNEHSDTLAYERSLARLRIADGRFDEALVVLERNVAMVRAGSENPLDLADALMLYGEAMQGAGRRAESEPALTEALALFEAALPDDHPDVAAPASSSTAPCQVSNSERASSSCRSYNGSEGGPRPTLLRTHESSGTVGWASAHHQRRSPPW